MASSDNPGVIHPGVIRPRPVSPQNDIPIPAVIIAADFFTRYVALESLWSAWKKQHASGLGYDPAFTEAVKKLEELEGGR